ncbi:MAG: YggS family pyridoxal phosphate-dependent enzyme [bacterium]
MLHTSPDIITQRIAEVKETIAKACLKIGKDPKKIIIVAVTKTVSPSNIIAGINAGLTIMGENRIQEAKEKISQINNPNVEWHLIGHLQTNKAKEAVRLFNLIHSVDNFKVAQELSKWAVIYEKNLSILIQVNIAGEETKSGIALVDVKELINNIMKLKNLSVKGLMIIPPYNPEPEKSRPYFRQLYTLAEGFRKDSLLGVEMSYLSMGMSNDFEVAIEEGANMVRLGTAIFGKR